MIKRMFVCAVVILVFALQSRARVIEGIAAVVNDDVITFSELSERMAPYLGAAEADLIHEIRKREIDSLIEERLIAQKAAKLGISVSREDVEKELASVRESFPSYEGFMQFLTERNLTEHVLRDRLKTRLLLRKAAEAEIMPRISPPSREDAKKFYDGNPGMFARPEEYRLSRILISPGEGGCMEEAQREIRRIERKIGEGGDFGSLARAHSDGPEAAEGGALGFVRAAEILPEIKAAVSNLSPGETTPAVRTSEGLSIFKVSDVREPVLADFAEVAESVKRHLFQIRMEEEVGKWLGNLRSRAHIKVNES